MLAQPLKKNRKAQTATSAGVLVGLIGLLIIIYILFLPPETRQELLTENATNSSSQDSSANKVLLDEKPGRLDASSMYDKYSDGHSVNDLVVKVTRNAAVIKTINPFYIKNNIFGAISKQVTFEVKNLEAVDNLMLSFAASSHSGRLIIKLNGEEIFNSEITSYNPNPIQLPKDNLVEGTNTLEFSVSSPGLAIWRENNYNLLDIKITGYITDLSYQKATASFEISDFEIAYAEKYNLKFYADCASSNRGKLTITINQNEVAAFVPECGSPYSIEASPEYFKQGQNRITFSTDSGLYSIEQIRIVPQFKEISYPIYYFDISQSDYSKIKSGTLGVRMYMRFPDNSEKVFNIRLNNILKRVSTKNVEYSINFSSSEILEGNNAIKIEPINTIYISELKVEYYRP
ncbi:MAG: hypothetical protein QXT20_02335 [Candidatus Woesearchaeota archaeon]